MADLKPCPNPWCPDGSKTFIIWDMYRKQVICTCGVKGPHCSANASDADWDEGVADAQAITAWSTRPPMEAAAKDMYDALKLMIDEPTVDSEDGTENG